MSAGLTIVPAAENRLDEVCALEEICFSQPWTRRQLEAQLDPSQYVFLTALDGAQLAGYGAFLYVLDEGYISNIAVAPEYRRQGVGGALLDALLESAASLCLAFLTLEVRESNKAARSLYESRGFQVVGLRRDYYSLPREDAILMTALLPPSGGGK